MALNNAKDLTLYWSRGLVNAFDPCTSHPDFRWSCGASLLVGVPNVYVCMSQSLSRLGAH